MITSIERELERNGRAVIQTTGVSMEPLLHHRRSSVVLVKPARPLRKNDVVLFKRNQDEYVLHRIVKLLPGGRYRIKGDNCFGYDDVSGAAVIGLMEGYYADESDTYTRCGSKQDRSYVRTLPVRHAGIWAEAVLYRIAKKIGLR